MRKHFIYYFLVVVILFSATFSATMSTSAENVLSLTNLLSLSPEAALNMLVEHGLVIPDAYLGSKADYQVAIEATAEILNSLSVDPRSTYGYNYEPTVKLAEGIRDLLKDEIEWPSKARSQGSYSITLNGNTYYSSYQNYNCYAYALGATGSFLTPGYHSGITLTPSQMCNVITVRNAINQDLLSMGYNVTLSSAKPSSLASGAHLICVRCASSMGEFHVMRAYTLNKWNHKPGVSAPLRLMDTSSTSPATNNWCNEMYLGTALGWSLPTINYNSAIWYLTYWL